MRGGRDARNELIEIANRFSVTTITDSLGLDALIFVRPFMVSRDPYLFELTAYQVDGEGFVPQPRVFVNEWLFKSLNTGFPWYSNMLANSRNATDTLRVVFVEDTTRILLNRILHFDLAVDSIWQTLDVDIQAVPTFIVPGRRSDTIAVKFIRRPNPIWMPFSDYRIQDSGSFVIPDSILEKIVARDTIEIHVDRSFYQVQESTRAKRIGILQTMRYSYFLKFHD